MEVKIVEKTKVLSKGNEHWLEIRDKFNQLIDGLMLEITGLSPKEANALRQYSYRVAKVRAFTRKRQGDTILYLYKKELEQ
ncbi:hypothetical protein LCGC14_0431080 [marine sediment metagenome]|uniref:Uncharacterized protein n=1 Tax=marine sediment metagenome TaxID=412755 RepID=A0A0F9VXJ2_9ZZZZ